MARLSNKAQRILGQAPSRRSRPAHATSGPPANQPPGPDPDPAGELLALLKVRKDAGVTPQELAKYDDWVIAALESRGYAISLKGGRIVLERDPKAIPRNPDAAAYNVFDPRRKSWRFLLISDSHIGGRQAQPWFLKKMFEEAEQRKCAAVFHGGDHVDGSPKMHAGFLYELVLTRADDQVDAAVQIYRNCQVPMFGIGGNHDGSWFKDAGLDVCRMIQERLDNYCNIGNIEGWVAGPNDDPNFLLLFHPQDGTSYSISYKPQKLAEYLVTENRRVPTCFTAIGHYHKRGLFDAANGSNSIMIPATCGTTAFMRAKKLVNQSGATFVEFSLDKNGQVDRFIYEQIKLWPHEWQSCDYSDFTRPRRASIGNVWGS